jgi:RNA methyltransferase, TrmH family
VTTITSRQNPLVQRLRECARRRPAGGEDILLDGAHLVGEALDAGVEIQAALVSAAARRSGEGSALAARLEAAGTPVHLASDAVMGAASPVRTPSGIVALGKLARRPAEAVWQPAPALVVAIVGVQDPGNVGAILRAAEAAGATGAFVTAGSADPFGWKSLRGSMGSALRLPIVVGMSVQEMCTGARRLDALLVATAPGGGEALYDIDLRPPLLLLIGGEGDGLPDDIVAGADARLRIPMRAPVESLNAAVAAGVVLFEARRQRGGAARP